MNSSIDSWSKKCISDLAENIYAGATPNTKIREYWEDGDIPWMSSGEINNEIIYSTQGFITQAGFNKSSTKIVPINSILIALAGQGKTRGKVAINKIELCTNQSLAAIVPNKQIFYKYLYYNLQYRYAELRELSSGDGGRGGLNLRLINGIEIDFPSVYEQKKIAEILTTWDDVIEVQNRLIEDKKKYLESIITQLVNRKIRFNEDTDSWIEKRLSDVCKIETGKLDANAMNPNGRYEFFTCAKENYRIDSYSFDCEALLIAGNGDIGKVKYYNGKFDAYQRTYVLSNFSENITFVKAYMDVKLMKQIVTQKQQGAMPYIKKSTLADFTIFFPNKSVQQKIVEIYNVINNEISLLERELEYKKMQKQGLMQQLLTGKIRVKVS